MITIKLTEEGKKWAREYSDKVGETSTLQTKENYTKLYGEDRYYKGACGEWAFMQFLRQNDVQFSWKPTADGKSDSGDFNIKEKIYDVKTSVKKNEHGKDYDNFLVSTDQLWKKCDYFVAVKIDLEEDIVEIWGYINKETIDELPTKQFTTPAKSFLLEDLYSPERIQ